MSYTEVRSPTCQITQNFDVDLNEHVWCFTFILYLTISFLFYLLRFYKKEMFSPKSWDLCSRVAIQSLVVFLCMKQINMVRVNVVFKQQIPKLVSIISNNILDNSWKRKQSRTAITRQQKPILHEFYLPYSS